MDREFTKHKKEIPYKIVTNNMDESDHSENLFEAILKKDLQAIEKANCSAEDALERTWKRLKSVL